MKITALKIKDRRFGNWHAEVENRWEYDDLRSAPDWREDWISFDCLALSPDSREVYCGLTALDGDILWTWDRRRREFRNCGFGAINSGYDAKFHRSLVWSARHRCLYGATALLHDVDRYWDAPGGAIIRYDPASRELQKVAVPMAHVYIQSICLDDARETIYGVTFTPERLFRCDLGTGEAEDLGPVSSGFEFTQGQNVELDAKGRAWTSWTVTRAWQNEPGPDSRRLCAYDRKTERIHFFGTGLPDPLLPGAYTRLDGLFNLGTGCLYASGGNGSLYRIDTGTGKAAYLGTPVADRPSRLSSMRLGPDGAAWAVAGMQGHCELMRFDPRAESWELLGEVRDGETACWQIHDIAIADDGVIYAAENDNPYRSSYLWEIAL
jgi:hypothetical protein